MFFSFIFFLFKNLILVPDSDMQLIIGPVGPRARLLEGVANDVFVSDLMTGKHFYYLGLSKINFCRPGYLLDP